MSSRRAGGRPGARRARRWPGHGQFQNATLSLRTWPWVSELRYPRACARPVTDMWGACRLGLARTGPVRCSLGVYACEAAATASNQPAGKPVLNWRPGEGMTATASLLRPASAGQLCRGPLIVLYVSESQSMPQAGRQGRRGLFKPKFEVIPCTHRTSSRHDPARRRSDEWRLRAATHDHDKPIERRSDWTNDDRCYFRHLPQHKYY